VGYLQYSFEQFNIDDRTLAHVQLVIVARLRKNEAFVLSWGVDPAHGSGRRALWIDRHIPIVFQFDGSRRIQINRRWLDAMMQRSYAVSGLELMPEGEHPDTSPDA
jgi:hypothetical protein